MTPCRVGAGESDDRGTTDESRITVFALTVAWAEEESDDHGTTDESRITVFALTVAWAEEESDDRGTTDESRITVFALLSLYHRQSTPTLQKFIVAPNGSSRFPTSC